MRKWKKPKWKRKHPMTFKSKSKFHSWYDQLWPLYEKFDSLRGKCFMFILMLLMTIVFPRVFQLLWFLKIDFFDNNLRIRTNRHKSQGHWSELIVAHALTVLRLEKKINNENLSTSDRVSILISIETKSHSIENHSWHRKSRQINNVIAHFFLELFKWNSFRWSWNGDDDDDVCSIAYI